MLNNSKVGSQIAFLRKQNYFTQEELAEKIGITAQAVSRWENGHTLPETALLPLLAQLFHCSIDSILAPFAARDSAFQDFVHAVCGNHGELVTQLYQRLKEKFNFTVTYDDKFYVFEAVTNSYSVRLNIPDKEDFIIRIDAEPETATTAYQLSVRIPLIHCSSYMHLIDKMPEDIKRKFRVSDCNSCTCNCPYCMVYSFEEVGYKQCHFITIHLDSAQNMEYIWALVCAEHEQFISDRVGSNRHDPHFSF